MTEAFDRSASVYDREFTFSCIGMAQRQAVWRYLDPVLNTPAMEILELNCGTGIDAVHMARAGHRIRATDVSGEMLNVARDTARQHGVEDRVTHERLAFHELGDRGWKDRYQLVFSNFGGLNCIDRKDLQALRSPVANALAPRGRFIAVVMPDRCLAETMHFLFHGEFSEAFRRGRHDPVWAGLSGSGVHTWYHAPRTMIDAFRADFQVKAVRPVAFFVPPTFLEPRFKDRPGTLERLSRWDERVARWRSLARYADHYLIDLERRA